MAAIKNLDVYQGDDHTWPLRLQSVDRTDPLNPIYTPFNLNGYTLLAHIRTAYADDAQVITANMTFQVTDADAGEVNMILNSESSATLSGRYKWDLEATRTADDYITTLLFGVIKAQKEVTRESG
jgi:hypothetical protein